MSNTSSKPVSQDPVGPMEEWEEPVLDPTYLPAPTIPGLLPAIAGDNHRNVVPRALQLSGLSLRVDLWDRTGFFNDFDILTVSVNGRPVHIETYDAAVTLPDPVIVDLGPKSALQTNGVKDISVHVLNLSDNDVNYNINRVYVDAQDPNYGSQPSRVMIEDYGTELTPAFLVGKAGLEFTIPTPADRRGGDTYRVLVGSNIVAIEDDVPVTGDITGHIPTATILERSGSIEVRYNLADRSGNTTTLSIPNYVQVSLNEAPVFGPVSVLEEPLVDKAEARNGATVRLESLTGHLQNDTLVVLWGTIEIYRQSVGMPVFPIDIPARFAAIAAGGNFYTADIKVMIERQGSPTYNAAVVQVDVDLREPGGQNPGEGPVDTNLAQPVLLGGGPDPKPDNRLSEKDRNFDATVTFTLPPGLEVGDFIDYVYGGDVVGTYPVTGAEAPDFPVPFTVPWATIDAKGNGTIETHCVIRDAINYKHSPNQDVVVEIFNIGSLTPVTFENATVITGNPNFTYAINCARQPWLGVPVKILDPGLLLVGDKVIIEAVRYAFNAPGAPIGTPIETSEFELNSEHVNLGLTVPLDLKVWLQDVTGNNGRGIVGVRWRLLRPSTGDRGRSDEVRAAWDLVGSGGNIPGYCVPGASRVKGTL